MSPMAKRWLNTIGPVLGLAGVYALFAILVGALTPVSFTSADQTETMLRQTTVVGIAALGMTLVIIAGGIDLSVGSVVALSGVVVAWLVRFLFNVIVGDPNLVGDAMFIVSPTVAEMIGWTSEPSLGAGWPLLAALAGVAVAGVAGAVTGLLVTQLRVTPFIVTLGMMLLVRGAAKGIAREQKIDAPMTWLSDLIATLGDDQKWMLFPSGVWVMIVLAVVVAALLRYTRLGRHIVAIGSNEQTARLCGVRVERTKLVVYMLGAALAGLAGLMQFARLTVGDPTVAVGLELQVIAAVVIGGGSLSGGEGSVVGTMAGALIITVINSGCQQLDVSPWIREIITGSIIVLAVALDRLRHRRAT